MHGGFRHISSDIRAVAFRWATSFADGLIELNDHTTSGDTNPMANMSQNSQAKEPIKVSEVAAALTLTGAAVLGTLAVSGGDYVRGYFQNMRGNSQAADVDMDTLVLPRVDQ